MFPWARLQAKEEVKKLIEKAQSNDLEAQPGRTIMESFENQVNQVCACSDIFKSDGRLFVH